MLRPGAEQEPGPASGPNPYVDLIAVVATRFAFDLVRKQIFHQGLDGKQESTKRTHQGKATHTRGRWGGRGGRSTVSCLSSRNSQIWTLSRQQGWEQTAADPQTSATKEKVRGGTGGATRQRPCLSIPLHHSWSLENIVPAHKMTCGCSAVILSAIWG